MYICIYIPPSGDEGSQLTKAGKLFIKRVVQKIGHRRRCCDDHHFSCCCRYRCRGLLGNFFGPFLGLRAGSWGSLGVHFQPSWIFIFKHFSMLFGHKRTSGLSRSLEGHIRAILTNWLKIQVFHTKNKDF